MRRESIAYVFTHILRSPAESEWKGHDGTISYIQNLLQIPSGSRNTIQKVLHNVVYCSVADVPYDSSIDGRINLGNSSAIKDGSIELQILADALEAGKSMDEATLLVNEHRFEDGSQPENSAPADLVTDYRKEENPYLARFGLHLWEKEIDKSITLRSSLCITSYITHMWEQTALAMHGTIHEDDWLVYHDALALMTAKRTVKWMTDTTTPDGKKYIDRWILPELGCNEDIPRFGKRPVGDFPEGMPLDCSLNNDLKASNRVHGTDTDHLPEEDNRKFSLSTPKRCSKAIRRLWDYGLTGKDGEDQHDGGVPCGKRIVQDVTRIVDSYKRIDKEAHGGFVVGLGNSDGKRAQQRRATGVKAVRGGRQNKMTQEEQCEVETPSYSWPELGSHPAIKGSSR